MSDYAQYPFAALQSVGGELATISERIGSTSGDAFRTKGLAADQASISAALDHFRSEWQASLQKLGENIGGFGDTSAQIGALSAQFDEELSRAMTTGVAVDRGVASVGRGGGSRAV